MSGRPHLPDGTGKAQAAGQTGAVVSNTSAIRLLGQFLMSAIRGVGRFIWGTFKVLAEFLGELFFEAIFRFVVFIITRVLAGLAKIVAH